MILHYEVSMTFFLPCVVLFYFLFYYCNYSYENALIRQQCFHDIVQRLVSSLRCCSQFSIPIIPLRASSFVINIRCTNSHHAMCEKTSYEISDIWDRRDVCLHSGPPWRLLTLLIYNPSGFHIWNYFRIVN